MITQGSDAHQRSGLPMASRPTAPCELSNHLYQIGVASKIQVSGREAKLRSPCTPQPKVAMWRCSVSHCPSVCPATK